MKIFLTFINLLVLLTLLINPNHIHAEDKLLYKEDFKYIGSFRVPKTDMGGPTYQGLAYGGQVITYNPGKSKDDYGSLFIVGHDKNQQVAEISIPEIIINNDINKLNTAAVIQELVDITNGNRNKITAKMTEDIVNGAKIGGLMKWGDKLIGSVYGYYDPGFNAVLSHFWTSIQLSSSPLNFSGMLDVGNKPSPVPQAGFISGYMTPIPDNWQQALGGKALSGMSGLSILSRTSAGPAAFSFDPDELVKLKSPAKVEAVNALLYYGGTIETQTIGTYNSSDTLYHMGTTPTGVIFPTGTRSIIFTGRHGLGDSCYGPGTNIKEEQGNTADQAPPHNTCMGAVMTDITHACCYDPLNLSKGGHSYPNVMYAWAYDAADLERVKRGGPIRENPSQNLVDSVSPESTENYKPWHIKPYAHWEIELPYAQNVANLLQGASAYDERTNRLYLVQTSADISPAYRDFPIIHVFKIDIGSGTNPSTVPEIKNINLN